MDGGLMKSMGYMMGRENGNAPPLGFMLSTRQEIIIKVTPPPVPSMKKRRPTGAPQKKEPHC